MQRVAPSLLVMYQALLCRHVLQFIYPPLSVVLRNLLMLQIIRGPFLRSGYQ